MINQNDSANSGEYKKRTVHNLIILDESGSMAHRRTIRLNHPWFQQPETRRAENNGIVDEDKITKRVEFTYLWKPNRSGQSLDPRSAAFGELPEDVRQILKKPKFNLFGTSSQLVNFTQARKGVAYFKKYDDGCWRMQNLTLL